MAADLSNTYVVHCADTVCTMGMRESKIVLEKSHGVFLKNQAQMTVKDQKGDANVINFGGCYSAENPNTVAEAEKIAGNVKEATGQSFEKQVKDIFTTEGEGGKVMACVGVCTPDIVSVQWDKEKEDVSVEPGQNALLGEATLTCKFGGTIKIIGTGQPEST